MTAVFESWQWRDPVWFWLLMAVPPLLVGHWLRRPRAAFVGEGWARSGAGRSPAPPLPRSWRVRLAAVPLALEALAVALAVAALARPVQRLPLPPERLGRDVLLCIDRSSSMAAMDLAPDRTRLQVGVEFAVRFVGDRPDDRLGFVEFARFPDLRCPPTMDHEALRELLGGIELVQRDGPEDATGIGAAVAAAADVLRGSSAKGKVVVLLTDGEENVATSAAPAEIAPLHAGQLCAELGVRVHAIVVGQGNQRADGRFVPLDTTAVRQLAAATGGRFFAARDAAALRAVGAEIDALEAVALAEPRVLVREGFAALLGLAVALVACAVALDRAWLRVVP